MKYTKKAFCLLLAVLLLAAMTACAAGNKNRDSSTTVVTGQTGNGEITFGDQTFPMDAEKLTLNLEIRSNEILDLSPLSRCTNLRQLSIHLTITPHIYFDIYDDAHIVEQTPVDLTPLASLTGLQRLDLRVGRISDLAPLTRLTNLQALVLWIDGEVDLAPLAGCPALKDLAIGGRGSVDLSPVKTFAGLTSLRVDVYDGEWNTPDLSALSGSPYLETLSTGGSRGLSQMKDVPLKYLVDLNDSGDILVNLPDLPTLEHIEFSDEHLSDIRPLLNRSPGVAQIVLEVGAQEIENHTIIRSADDPLLNRLLTNIPTEQLRNLLSRGGVTITLRVNQNREAGGMK